MAASWIKVRNGLSRSAKIVSMACYLAEQQEFVQWWNHNNGNEPSRPVTQFVTKEFVTAVTLKALTELWQEINDIIGEDCWIPYLTLSQIDILTGVPRLGEAMFTVGWVEEHHEKGLVFPNFYEFNKPEKSRPKAMTDAERAKKSRDKKKAEQARHDRHDSSHREEKKREDKNNPPPPTPPQSEPSRNDQLEAEEVLSSCGVSAPREAVREAFERGAKLPDIVAICDHFRSIPGAWGPGLLHTRVKGFRPGQPSDADWPKLPDKIVSAQREEQIAAEKEKAREQDAIQRAKDARLRHEREQRYGQRIDSLDDAGLQALIHRLDLPEFQRLILLNNFRKNGRASPAFLADLYLALDRKKESAAAVG